MVLSDSLPPMDCSPPGSSVHGILVLDQEHWKWVAFPSPGDLPNPGIEHASRALQADFLSPGSIKYIHNTVKLLCRTFSTCKSESLSPYPLITTVLLSVSMNLFPALLSKYSFLSLPSASVQFWLIMPLRKREPSIIFTEVL